ncbi:jg22976 [Pararge aegeria aegeria]|uniref:Jg22976 protein n=1 Tax=Pararge aegeria aegeria TaxID=348720 RepID=A0A8S4QWZ6_9NEOP|nr:jg22976 [Pararge aegeria aegeria]
MHYAYSLFPPDKEANEETEDWHEVLMASFKRPRTYAEVTKKAPKAPNSRINPTSNKQHECSKYTSLIVDKLTRKDYHFYMLKKKIGRYPTVRVFERSVKFSPPSEYEFGIVHKYLTNLEKSEKIAWIVCNPSHPGD